jgi:S-(hydroxymethyl)glutathione dehydrogenase/alcohol dehydrogenase
LLVDLNKPLELADLELTALKIGQVLVKVIASGICGSQLHEIKGFKGNGKFLPHLMGHEGFGEVLEVGVGVTKIKTGDKVVMHWRVSEGLEAEFPNYIYKGQKISSGKITTLSELSIVSENRLTKVPKDTNEIFGALLGCAITTAFGVIENEAKLRFGETVAVIGCGGLGLSLIQAAKIRGAGLIYGVDSNNYKKIRAEESGAFMFLNSIEDLTSQVDVVIDTTGKTQLWNIGIGKLRTGGRMVLIGQPKPGESFSLTDPMKLFANTGIKIIATQGGKSNPTEDIPRYLDLFETGLINLDLLVSHEFQLADINTAIDTLISGDCARIIIKVS